MLLYKIHGKDFIETNHRKLSVVGCCCSREERAGDKKMGKFTPGKRRDGACNSFLSRTEDLMESMD